jgi:hypothetical protein
MVFLEGGRLLAVAVQGAYEHQVMCSLWQLKLVNL